MSNQVHELCPRAGLASHVAQVENAARALAGQAKYLLQQVADAERQRDEAEQELAALQAQIDEAEDAAESSALEAIREERDEANETAEELDGENKKLGERISDLLDLVARLAELAHDAHPSEVEYLLRLADCPDPEWGEAGYRTLGSLASRLQIEKQLTLPLTKAKPRRAAKHVRKQGT